MKYLVNFKIDARFATEVEADSIEDAKSKAEMHVMEADFGDAEVVDFDPVYVKDDDDNFLWETT